MAEVFSFVTFALSICWVYWLSERCDADAAIMDDPPKWWIKALIDARARAEKGKLNGK